MIGTQFTKPPAPEHDSLTAYVVSQDFISDRLKSPSSARFPLFSDSSVKVNYIGDTRYQIFAYVDSQNSFGAMIKSNYDCIVKYTDDKKWTLEEIHIE